jgi:potassium-transporting ATPase KdpC subunit
MSSQFRPALVSLILLTVITGAVYPAIVTAVAKVAFRDQSSGSIITISGKPVGSELIGQPFSDPKYFWPRPSATSPIPYAGDNGSGSNLAPTNPALADAVKQRVAALRAADPLNQQPIPVDLVTASGSGLDPHISVAAAEYQAARVARARGVATERVELLIRQFTQGRSLGFLGEERVNVLELNLALDRQ